MAMKVPLDWEPYRRQGKGWEGDRGNGAFVFPARNLKVICTNGMGWEHASVSSRERCPTWDEMEWVKRALWAPEDACMQLHVAVAEHRSCHPYCLHIWRPMGEAIPLPPSIMVAP